MRHYLWRGLIVLSTLIYNSKRRRNETCDAVPPTDFTSPTPPSKSPQIATSSVSNSQTTLGSVLRDRRDALLIDKPSPPETMGSTTMHDQHEPQMRAFDRFEDHIMRFAKPENGSEYSPIELEALATIVVSEDDILFGHMNPRFMYFQQAARLHWNTGFGPFTDHAVLALITNSMLMEIDDPRPPGLTTIVTYDGPEENDPERGTTGPMS